MSDWEEKVALKKKEVTSKIPAEWILPAEFLKKFDQTTPVSVLDVPKQFLNEHELDITENYTVKELLESLKSGSLSAVDVVTAFSHRTAIANQLINCCTEILFEYGLERAKFLDEYLEKNLKPFGPLHGLPISLKDTFNIPGYDSTIGYVSSIGNGSDLKEISAIVKQLGDLGAVFYVKTNIPQTLMTADSENNIFGRTLNPSNLTWTAGGSSGGEGALIKFRGSLIGIGTDIAGSVRIPAICNGTYGYKPTVSRIPRANQMTTSREVYHGITSITGPLSSDFESLHALAKEIYTNEPWKYDPAVYRIKYQIPDINVDSKLKIGVILADDYYPVHPPIKRFINESAEKLKNAGHSVTFIDSFPSYKEAQDLAISFFKLDPKSIALPRLLSSQEKIIKSLVLLSKVKGDGPQNIDDLINHTHKRKIITDAWLKLFDDYDVIISPGSPSTAPPHDEFGISPYSVVWNLVDFPAVVIPYGKVDASVDLDDDIEYPAELEDIYAKYDPSAYDGGIGHIQVSAPRLEDEKLLAASAIIDKVLNP